MFSTGDQVDFLNEPGGGVVISMNEDGTFQVKTAEGFDFTYPANELVLRKNDQQYIIDEQDEARIKEKLHHEEREKQEADFQRKFRHIDSQDARKGSDTTEVDLHIEQLVDIDYRKMSNAEILSIQISQFERMMQFAITHQQQKIIFIHGVGEGVLKGEIRRLLKDVYPQVEFHDASYRKYGYGATEVVFR